MRAQNSNYQGVPSHRFGRGTKLPRKADTVSVEYSAGLLSTSGLGPRTDTQVPSYSYAVHLSLRRKILVYPQDVGTVRSFWLKLLCGSTSLPPHLVHRLVFELQFVLNDGLFICMHVLSDLNYPNKPATTWSSTPWTEYPFVREREREASEFYAPLRHLQHELHHDSARFETICDVSVTRIRSCLVKQVDAAALVCFKSRKNVTAVKSKQQMGINKEIKNCTAPTAMSWHEWFRVRFNRHEFYWPRYQIASKALKSPAVRYLVYHLVHELTASPAIAWGVNGKCRLDAIIDENF